MEGLMYRRTVYTQAECEHVPDLVLYATEPK